ncbi:MAG TPA: alpha/beta hydrolase, partial [Actinomycetota bacterium]|nr:alpha/beta hydrolase [Actinomycetota bacterium]
DAPLALAGWSFGAAVAVRAAAGDDGLLAIAAIAPPVVARPGVTAGLPAPERARLAAPLLTVCGDNDHLVAVEDCLRWARGAGARVVVVEGGNHFFWGRYERLTATVADFLDDPFEFDTPASGIP